MNIHEYQAKKILKDYKIPVASGVVILNKSEIDDVINNFNSPTGYVVKAQIHAGGRGLGGGVKVVKTKNEAISVAHKMYGMNLVTKQTGSEGKEVKRLYIESAEDIDKEYYLSMVFDRSNSMITIIASSCGGVDIEDVAEKSPEKVVKISIDTGIGIEPYHSRNIGFQLGFSGQTLKLFSTVVESIYKCFIETDAMQIEINPLVLLKNGNFLVLDAKMNFDDNALFRHQEILDLRDEDEEDKMEVEAAKHGLSYVKMSGNIGCMVNGAGLAMATMDIIKLHGGSPANFLDVGGSADQERVSKAFKIILSDDSVRVILVNIFGGIMHCDVIARGIIEAVKEVHIKIPLVVRLAGTHFEEGNKIINNAGFKIIASSDLNDAAEKVVHLLKNTN